MIPPLAVDHISLHARARGQRDRRFRAADISFALYSLIYWVEVEVAGSADRVATLRRILSPEFAAAAVAIFIP
jgi:hypothetical protein